MTQVNRQLRRFSRRALIAGGVGVLASGVLTTSAHGAKKSEISRTSSATETCTWTLAGYPEIGAIVERIHEVLSFNANEFEGRLGRVYGINAGRWYPHVFARDLATISEFIGYLFDPAYQRTPVEEFLWTQHAFEQSKEMEGAVAATISPARELDKATAVSDEETSVIHIAYQHFRMGAGAIWLAKQIGTKTVIERLNEAINYVIRSRRDAKTGLIFRAHTSDWGDVKLEGGAHPTDLLSGDTITASIFDQSLAFRALGQIAEMNKAIGNEILYSRYMALQAEIRSSAQANLWSDPLGRYLIHKHLSRLPHPFDEEAIVSFGNAVAVHTGLATQDQIPSILETLGEMAHRAGTQRAGLSLWPPYPKGTFNHPNMQPFGYQNGGLWDWWAGIQMLAEFEGGASKIGFAHLLETAKHWTKSDTIAEWFHLPSATDQGSPDFGGAAGTVGLSVVRGLFGIRMSDRTYTITSRLGSFSGSVKIQNQHSGATVAYTQRSGDGWTTMDVTGTTPEGGAVSMLVPNDWPDAMVLVDDRSQAVGIQTVMYDSLTTEVHVPTGTHTVTVIKIDAKSPTTGWSSGYGQFFLVGDGQGYWITDSSGIPLWSGYLALGGVAKLGPAISGRFLLNGRVSQAVNAAILQWVPQYGHVLTAPIFDLLSQAGYDNWLQATHHIPAHGSPDLSVLDQNPSIKAYFFNNPDWRNIFGMPVAYIEHPHVAVLRAENQAFQHWKIRTPWGAQPGDVTTVNAGAIAAEARLVPSNALTLSRGTPASYEVQLT